MQLHRKSRREVGHFSLHGDGTVAAADDVACELSGYTRGELLDTPFDRYIAQRSLYAAWSHFMDVLAGTPRSDEIVIVRKDGSELALIIATVPEKDPNGAMTGLSGIVQRAR